MSIIHNKSITDKLVVGLVFAGMLAILLRFSLYSPESVPSGDSVWELTMSVNIDSDKNRPTIYMAIPKDSASNRVISQSFMHHGFDLKRLTQRKNVAAREIIAVAQDKGKLSLTGEFKIHVSPTMRWQKWLKTDKPLSSEDRSKFLELPAELQIDDTKLIDALKPLRSNTNNQEALIEEIFKLSHRKILSDENVVYESIEKVLSSKRADALGKTNTMVALFRASKIPARLVAGVVVKEMLDVTEHYWVEIYVNDLWKSYDPFSGYAGDLPATYLKLRENNSQLAYLEDGLPLNVDIDIVQIPVPAGLMGTGEKKFSDIFDLSRLPISTQILLSSLLLLPLGALITIIFRNIIGVQTYGTFTSSLLALSMIYADWITVVVVVGLVTFTGIAGLSLLPKKMSRVPRLSVVMTIVAITVVFSVSLMDFYNLNPNASVVLLPIIVMVSLVDRVYAITDEKGLTVAIYRLFWTCLVAAVCFVVFSVEAFGQQLVSYPEIHLFTLSLILIISTYKMKVLTDMPLLLWMKEPNNAKNTTG